MFFGGLLRQVPTLIMNLSIVKERDSRKLCIRHVPMIARGNRVVVSQRGDV